LPSRRTPVGSASAAVTTVATSSGVVKYRPEVRSTSRLNDTSKAMVAAPAPIARSSEGLVPPTECPCR
jgi:hypothetical protein